MNKTAILGMLILGAARVSATAAADVVIETQAAAIRTEGGPNAGGGWNLWSNGQVGQPLRFATAGAYSIVARAWGSPAGGVWPEMALLVDGKSVKTATVATAEHDDYRFEVNVTAGIHEIAVGFVNDAVVGDEDRNLYLERFTITPPPEAADPVLVALKELAEVAEQREREIVAAAQADYAVKFYRVCFAHPAMQAITWWDLCDQGSWLPGGGMLRADKSPKPVYEQLKRLIHEEWKTSAAGTTDAAGWFPCRGFLGKYRLVIQMPGGKVEQNVRLTKDGPSEIIVRLPASPTK